jgi:hypothetical protein
MDSGWAKVIPLSRAMKNREAYAMWVSETGAAVEDRAKGIEALIAYTSANAADSGTEAASTGDNGLVWGVSILCFSVIFGGRLAAFIVRGINNSLTLAVTELSQGADQGSEEAFESMRAVGQRVTEAHHTLADMTKSIAEIDASTGKISKTIKVIDEIGFQANILALSAALEAACAREAGLGFAVVSDEVRDLAQRSAQATEGASKVKGLISQVEASSKEQARGIEQISKEVAQLQEIVGASQIAIPAATKRPPAKSSVGNAFLVVAKPELIAAGATLRSKADFPLEDSEFKDF